MRWPYPTSQPMQEETWTTTISRLKLPVTRVCCTVFQPSFNHWESQNESKSGWSAWFVKSMILLLMAEILHQLIGILSHCLQGFIHPRWCRIWAINSIKISIEIPIDSSRSCHRLYGRIVFSMIRLCTSTFHLGFGCHVAVPRANRRRKPCKLNNKYFVTWKIRWIWGENSKVRLIDGAFCQYIWHGHIVYL